MSRPAAFTAFVSSCLIVSLVQPLTAQAGSPAGPVPVERLEARRAALAKRMGTGIAILRSSSEKDIEADYPQDSDYREANDFFYLTGIEAPDAWLVLVARGSAPPQATLYLQPRDTVTPYRSEQWVGRRITPGPEAVALTGIRDVRSADLAVREIQALVFGPSSPARQGKLYVSAAKGQADSPFLRDTVLARAQAGAGLQLAELGVETAALRLVKDADEIARLRRAIDITAEAQRQAIQAVKPGVHEYEAEALIEYTFRRRGAERLGFPSIVGSGPNSTLLHYDKNRRRMEAADLVVIDIGAEFGYYSADVTRTLPVSGKFTTRQRAIYELVLASQQAAIDSIRPGSDIRTLERVARTYMRAHSGNLCGSSPCDRYFVHGLSHWLGMDVHDVGRMTTPFQPGMVLTVEPGIYLPEEGLGVRIEDDVLVTQTGHEVLSAGAPKRPEEIEAQMQAR